MGKKIVVVNAGPRKGWNTDILLSEASDGAVSVGAEIQRFDLFKLERYTGCISCFGCKREKFKGHCICRDGLTPVLDAIETGDGSMSSGNRLNGDSGRKSDYTNGDLREKSDYTNGDLRGF